MSRTSPSPTAPSNGQAARRLETHRRLLEAGTELFAECGVAAATSTAIARRAGVATGTFYLHFPDKHALFEVLVDEALEEMGAQFGNDDQSSRSDGDRRDQIHRMVEVAERRRNLIRAVFDRGDNPHLAERIQDRIASRMEPIYARHFRQRGIPLHPGGAAQARAAVLVRVIAWWAEDPSRATRDELVDILLELDPLHPARGESGPPQSPITTIPT